MSTLRFVTAGDVFVFLSLLLHVCRGEQCLKDPPVCFLTILAFVFLLPVLEAFIAVYI